MVLCRASMSSHDDMISCLWGHRPDGIGKIDITFIVRSIRSSVLNCLPPLTGIYFQSPIKIAFSNVGTTSTKVLENLSGIVS